jgi:hypothetical protein
MTKALQDGIAVDVTGQAAQAGFRNQTVIGVDLCTMLEPTLEEQESGETFEKRVAEMLQEAHKKAMRTDGNRFTFKFYIRVASGFSGINAIAVMYPGDEGQPVIFIGISSDF